MGIKWVAGLAHAFNLNQQQQNGVESIWEVPVAWLSVHEVVTPNVSKCASGHAQYATLECYSCALNIVAKKTAQVLSSSHHFPF